MLKFLSTKLRCGLFVITASAFVSGCSFAPQRMEVVDLDYFVVDCRYKEEQLRFINSQRTNRGQQVNAGLVNFFTPWRIVTDPEGYAQNAQMNNRRHEWMINQVLHELSRCP